MISFQVVEEELTHSHDEKHSETLGDLHLRCSFENELIIPAQLRSFYLNHFSSFFFFFYRPLYLGDAGKAEDRFRSTLFWSSTNVTQSRICIVLLFFRFLFFTTFYLLLFLWQRNLDILLNS